MVHFLPCSFNSTQMRVENRDLVAIRSARPFAFISPSSQFREIFVPFTIKAASLRDYNDEKSRNEDELGEPLNSAFVVVQLRFNLIASDVFVVAFLWESSAILRFEFCTKSMAGASVAAKYSFICCSPFPVDSWFCVRVSLIISVRQIPIPSNQQGLRVVCRHIQPHSFC